MDKHIAPKIAVIGDIMIDINYISNKLPSRFAQEAHDLPIYNIDYFTYGLGGAANVAEGLKNLGCDVTVFGVVGNDHYGTKIVDLLKERDIKHSIFIDETRHTTQKHRTFLGDVLISRFDIENNEEILEYEQNRIVSSVINAGVDVIILCDYDKGVLTDFICKTLIKYSSDSGIYTFVDPKTRSYKKYRGCFCFKPNFYEASTISGFSLYGDTGDGPPVHIKNTEDAEHIIRKLHDRIKFNHVVLTDGEMGLYCAYFDWTREQTSSIASPKTLKHISSEHIENVVDITGAGDTIMIALVYVFMISGGDMVKAAEVANYFGGISITKLGNYKITKNELFDYIKSHMSINEKIDNNSNLYPLYPSVEITPSKLREIETKRSRKIVFTNGCFDILNSAHLRLLNYCRKFGEILVVGLNSDNSVRRLKGSSRPVNNLQERVACLREIGIVDYIYVFDEDTPIELTRNLEPDVIVKGGNYQVEDVVGREYAKRVEIFRYVKGVSTSDTIREIRSASSLYLPYP